MNEIRVDQEAQVPASRAWEVMTDLPRWVHVLTAVEAVERLDDGEAFDVGTRWRETRTMFGRQAVEEMWVTAVDEGRSYTVEAESPGIRYRSVVSVEPLGDDRCRLGLSMAAEPTGLLARVLGATLGRLFVGSVRKALHQDLVDIARAAEQARETAAS